MLPHVYSGSWTRLRARVVMVWGGMRVERARVRKRLCVWCACVYVSLSLSLSRALALSRCRSRSLSLCLSTLTWRMEPVDTAVVASGPRGCGSTTRSAPSRLTFSRPQGVAGKGDACCWWIGGRLVRCRGARADGSPSPDQPPGPEFLSDEPRDETPNPLFYFSKERTRGSPGVARTQRAFQTRCLSTHPKRVGSEVWRPFLSI